MLHSLRVSILVLPISVLLAGDATPPKPPAAVKVLDLFDRLQSAQRKTTARQTPQHVAFDLSEREVNDYAVYALHVTPRPGLRSFTVKFFAKNYVSTLALIDFDAIERWRPGTIPALLRPVLKGPKTIWVDCRFQAANGRATFSVEKAYFEKIRLPAFFVEKMIQIVAARQPEHYDTTKPVPLPFGLRNLWTKERGILGEN